MISLSVAAKAIIYLVIAVDSQIKAGLDVPHLDASMGMISITAWTSSLAFGKHPVQTNKRINICCLPAYTHHSKSVLEAVRLGELLWLKSWRLVDKVASWRYVSCHNFWQSRWYETGFEVLILLHNDSKGCCPWIVRVRIKGTKKGRKMWQSWLEVHGSGESVKRSEYQTNQSMCTIDASWSAFCPSLG